MSNPFRLRWLQGWNFQLVLMEGNVKVEAYGFGICLRTSLLPGEAPSAAADRLVLSENDRRKAHHKSWIKSKALNSPSEIEPNFINNPSSQNTQNSLLVAKSKENINSKNSSLTKELSLIE